MLARPIQCLNTPFREPKAPRFHMLWRLPLRYWCVPRSLSWRAAKIGIVGLRIGELVRRLKSDSTEHIGLEKLALSSFVSVNMTFKRGRAPVNPADGSSSSAFDDALLALSLELSSPSSSELHCQHFHFITVINKRQKVRN